MADFDISGRVAVVTGAAQGNGAAIARALAAAGAEVAICDIDGDGVSAVAAEIRSSGGAAMAAQVDVSDLAALRKFADRVASEMGPARILVANAGVIRRTPVEAETFEEDWDFIFSVNVTGARNTVRAFLPQLVETGGAIVTLGSIMSLTAGPNAGAYAASKGAVAQFTKALAHDLAPKGVRVNAIAPGVIATPMTEVTRATPEVLSRFMGHTPMGRVGEPEELTGPVLFLVSDAASYVTGAVLPVDGGYLAG